MTKERQSDAEILSQLLNGIDDKQIHLIVKPELLIQQIVNLINDVKNEIFRIENTKKVTLDTLYICNNCRWNNLIYPKNCPKECTYQTDISQILFGSRYTIIQNGMSIEEIQNLTKIKYSEERDKRKDSRIVELEAEIKIFNDLIKQIVLKCIH